MIAQDEFLLWTNSEEPYKTAAEYLDAVKAAPPGKFKMGGTGAKREDQIITVALEKAADVKFTYVPYKSGGEAVTQLVGKHTNSNVNNPSENIAPWRARPGNATCALSNERMAFNDKITQDQSWDAIPTCTSEGTVIQ